MKLPFLLRDKEKHQIGWRVKKFQKKNQTASRSIEESTSPHPKPCFPYVKKIFFFRPKMKLPFLLRDKEKHQIGWRVKKFQKKNRESQHRGEHIPSYAEVEVEGGKFRDRW
jgi:hypothetical protein